MIYATCIACEYEISGKTFEELDKKFKQHFILAGHESYFYQENNIEKIRKVSV